MKTTLDISDPLLDQVRRIAARDGDTLRSLVEQGLRKVVAERSAKAKPFKLKDCSVGTPGVQSGYEKLSWEEMRALMYESHGAWSPSTRICWSTRTAASRRFTTRHVRSSPVSHRRVPHGRSHGRVCMSSMAS